MMEKRCRATALRRTQAGIDPSLIRTLLHNYGKLKSVNDLTVT